MAVQNENQNEEKNLHQTEQDPQLVQTVELADSSSQRAVPCSCGFLHPKLTEGHIDITLGYEEETKTFKPVQEYDNSGIIIFTHNHPHYNGKL